MAVVILSLFYDIGTRKSTGVLCNFNTCGGRAAVVYWKKFYEGVIV